MNLLQIYLWVWEWLSAENRLAFEKVMGNSLVSCFFDSRCTNTSRALSAARPKYASVKDSSHMRCAARWCAALVKTLLVFTSAAHQRAAQRMCERQNTLSLLFYSLRNSYSSTNKCTRKRIHQITNAHTWTVDTYRVGQKVVHLTPYLWNHLR